MKKVFLTLLITSLIAQSVNAENSALKFELSPQEAEVAKSLLKKPGSVEVSHESAQLHDEAQLRADEAAILQRLEGKSTTQEIPAQVPVAEVKPVFRVAEPQLPVAIVPIKEEIKASLNPQMEITAAREANSESQEMLKKFQDVVSTNTNLTGKLEKYSSEITALRAENNTLKQNLKNTSVELSSRTGKATSASKELQEARDRLMLAEIEIERLSNLLGERTRYAVTGVKPVIEKKQEIQPAVDPVEARKELLSDDQERKSDDDMMIATVTAEKINLRTGPGRNNSPLMSVSKGTKLVVETKLGDWYRVIAPSGARAWVASDVVVFGKDPHSAPTRTVKVAGFNSELEDAAFNNIMGITNR